MIQQDITKFNNSGFTIVELALAIAISSIAGVLVMNFYEKLQRQQHALSALAESQDMNREFTNFVGKAFKQADRYGALPFLEIPDVGQLSIRKIQNYSSTQMVTVETECEDLPTTSLLRSLAIKQMPNGTLDCSLSIFNCRGGRVRIKYSDGDRIRYFPPRFNAESRNNKTLAAGACFFETPSSLTVQIATAFVGPRGSITWKVRKEHITVSESVFNDVVFSN
jgi:Tfp pilus assembly protein PilE